MRLDAGLRSGRIASGLPVWQEGQEIKAKPAADGAGRRMRYHVASMWPAWRVRSRLQDMPAEERTPEACLEAVREDGWALEFVPQTLRTPDLCLEAVKSDGDALRFVP